MGSIQFCPLPDVDAMLKHDTADIMAMRDYTAESGLPSLFGLSCSPGLNSLTGVTGVAVPEPFNGFVKAIDKYLASLALEHKTKMKTKS